MHPLLAAERSETTVEVHPDIHTLNIGIRPPMGAGDRPFRTRTVQSTALDFDTGGRLRNIEVQVADKTTSATSLRAPRSRDGYFMLLLGDGDIPANDEHLFYDAKAKIGCLSFTGTVPTEDEIYRLSDDLALTIDAGGISAIWLLGVDLSPFLQPRRRAV